MLLLRRIPSVSHQLCEAVVRLFVGGPHRCSQLVASLRPNRGSLVSVNEPHAAQPAVVQSCIINDPFPTGCRLIFFVDSPRNILAECCLFPSMPMEPPSLTPTAALPNRPTISPSSLFTVSSSLLVSSQIPALDNHPVLTIHKLSFKKYRP